MHVWSVGLALCCSLDFLVSFKLCFVIFFVYYEIYSIHAFMIMHLVIYDLPVLDIIYDFGLLLVYNVDIKNN